MKRFFALFLAVVLLVSSIPLSAVQASATEGTPPVTDGVPTPTEETPEPTEETPEPAEEPPATRSSEAAGSCGTSVSWALAEGVLTISGTGNMSSYGSAVDVPWNQYRDQITQVVIEPGVTSIGDYAFEGCANLLSASIPAGITYIGYAAFPDCCNLTSAPLPESVIDIEAYAFYNCAKLSSVTLPQGLDTIGWEAFNGCASLTDIYLADLGAWMALHPTKYPAPPRRPALIQSLPPPSPEPAIPILPPPPARPTTIR